VRSFAVVGHASVGASCVIHEALAAVATVTLSFASHPALEAGQTLALHKAVTACTASLLHSPQPAHVAPPECMGFGLAAIAEFVESAQLVVAVWLVHSAAWMVCLVCVELVVLASVVASLPRPIAATVQLAVTLGSDLCVHLTLPDFPGVLRAEHPAATL